MNIRRACIFFGLVTLSLAIIGVITTPKSCGDDRGLGPVMALELSVNATQLGALISTPECAAALRENTLGDIFAFIPSFTAFLIFGALLVGRRLAVLLFALGAILDWLEDAVMLHVLRSWTESPSALFFASRLKFLVLSLGVLLLGWTVMRLARAPGLAMMIGGTIALIGLLLEHRLLMPGTLVAWLALIVFSIRAPRSYSSESSAGMT